MVPSDHLTEEQLKMRKNWLAWSILRQMWFFLNSCILPFMIVSSGMIDGGKYSGSVIGTFMSSLLAILVGYICAYKNYGTRFLNFLLIIAPIAFMQRMFDLAHIPLTYLGLILILLIVDVTSFFFWYRLTLKMRKLNYKIKNTIKLPE